MAARLLQRCPNSAIDEVETGPVRKGSPGPLCVDHARYPFAGLPPV